MSLTKLPTELQIEILSHLDLRSLLRLASTNRYFSQLPTKSILREAWLSFELEHRAVLRIIHKRPCYGCLRIRNDRDFSDGVWLHFIDSFDKGYSSSQLHERRCSECDNQDGGRLEQALRRQVHAAMNSCLLGFCCCRWKRDSCLVHARCARKIILDIIKEYRNGDAWLMKRSTQAVKRLSDPVIS